jgi:hypothetical protein
MFTLVQFCDVIWAWIIHEYWCRRIKFVNKNIVQNANSLSVSHPMLYWGGCSVRPREKLGNKIRGVADVFYMKISSSVTPLFSIPSFSRGLTEQTPWNKAWEYYIDVYYALILEVKSSMKISVFHVFNSILIVLLIRNFGIYQRKHYFLWYILKSQIDIPLYKQNLNRRIIKFPYWI